MLEIEIADKAGACYGVMRALEMTREAAERGGTVHTLGPLIHNPRVVDELAHAGAGVAMALDEAGEGTLVLRSHGTAPDVVQEAVERGFEVVDATCPFVAKVQRKAREFGDAGYGVVIIGEPGHAEVEGIRAWGGEAVIAVTDKPEGLPAELPGRVGVVIQTTQSQERVDAVVSALEGRVADLQVAETVCFATQERQRSARDLASRADAMVVIGGRNSGNTRRLYEICASLCANTHHIEDAAEIEDSWFDGAALAGVTAGASTPEEHILAVRDRIGAVQQR